MLPIHQRTQSLFYTFNLQIIDILYYLHKGYHIGLYLIDNKRRILYVIKYESNSSKNFRSILCLTEKLSFLDDFDFIKSNVKRIYGSRQLENPFLIVMRLQKQRVIFFALDA